MARSQREANHYDLKSGTTHITYSASSLAGKAQLSYHDEKHQDRTYSGAQIRAAQTDIGMLVTVVLEDAPDLETLTLSLLIPAVNIQGDPEPIETTAILTTHRTSITGPALVKGALQTYRPLPIIGTASAVEF